MNLNPQLLEKYNKPVPRYTSYPPANFFEECSNENNYRKALVTSNDHQPQNISLYFHIPFCTKLCHYCGCNAYGMRSAPTVRNYVNALLTELEIVRPFLSPHRKVSQVHFGGGTPNALDAEMIGEIMDKVNSLFSYIDDPEIAIECNPAYLNYNYIDQLIDKGFNRFSLGIQDFKREVLDAVNRDPSALPVDELMRYIRTKNPKAAINLDFIYGLPLQSVESFTATIQKAIKLRPDRLVTFSYAHLPSIFKAQKKLEVFNLPDSNLKSELFLKAYEIITNSGYQAIGLDHYALKEDELAIAQNNRSLHRNFQGYCTRRTTGQVYAFGVSAISQLDELYTQNTKRIDEYIEKLGNGELPLIKWYDIKPEEKITRTVINEFMCNLKVVWSEIADQFNISTEKLKEIIGYNSEQLNEFALDGLIDISPESVELKEGSLLFIRNIAASFDPLLKTSDKSFSKSV